MFSGEFFCIFVEGIEKRDWYYQKEPHDPGAVKERLRKTPKMTVTNGELLTPEANW